MTEYHELKRLIIDIIEKSDPDGDHPAKELYLKILTLISIISLSLLHNVSEKYKDCIEEICIVDFHVCTEEVLNNIRISINNRIAVKQEEK